MLIRNFDRYYDPPEDKEWCTLCDREFCADDMVEIDGAWYCQDCAEIIDPTE